MQAELTDDSIVRNDEVVGSSPTSSTIFQSLRVLNYLKPIPICSKPVARAGKSLPQPDKFLDHAAICGSV